MALTQADLGLHWIGRAHQVVTYLSLNFTSGKSSAMGGRICFPFVNMSSRIIAAHGPGSNGLASPHFTAALTILTWKKTATGHGDVASNPQQRIGGNKEACIQRQTATITCTKGHDNHTNHKSDLFFLPSKKQLEKRGLLHMVQHWGFLGVLIHDRQSSRKCHLAMRLSSKNDNLRSSANGLGSLNSASSKRLWPRRNK